MDLIEGTNRISNEKDRIDRIFFDSREEVRCAERVCANSGKVVHT